MALLIIVPSQELIKKEDNTYTVIIEDGASSVLEPNSYSPLNHISEIPGASGIDIRPVTADEGYSSLIGTQPGSLPVEDNFNMAFNIFGSRGFKYVSDGENSTKKTSPKSKGKKSKSSRVKGEDISCIDREESVLVEALLDDDSVPTTSQAVVQESIETVDNLSLIHI